MPTIKLITDINAPIDIVFDLSRSIELHEESTRQTNEKAIAGKTSGLIEFGEKVTWRAKHFGINHKLKVVISKMEKPYYFQDKMVLGIFEDFTHDHYFEEKNGKTEMKDVFNYTSPLFILGKLADFLFLKKYMTLFLENRNSVIKEFAENKELREQFLMNKNQ